MRERPTPCLVIVWSALIVGIRLAVPASAAADPVQIATGALIWTGSYSANVTATSASGALTIYAHGAQEAASFAPWATCAGVPECRPGSTIPLNAIWIGEDLQGTATFNGTSYLVGYGRIDSAQAGMQWAGALTLPEDFAGGTLTAPFSFAGFFSYPAGPNFSELTRLSLVGHGSAALTFAASRPFPGAFQLTAARYDFEPTPEPASLILLATGIAGTWATRRREKRRRHQPPATSHQPPAISCQPSALKGGPSSL